MLPFSFASNFSFARSRPDVMAQADQQSIVAPAVTDPSSNAESGGIERVSGIGGLFFRAQDPSAVAQWYQKHLGISLTPSKKGDLPWRQEAGPTAFTPFPEKTKYFGDASKGWMVNFRVRDLDKLTAQLRASGIAVEVDPTPYPNGRFARLHDLEGNPIELWQST